MKQNSQSRREISVEALEAKKLRQEFSYVRRYNFKNLNERLDRLKHAKQINHSERLQINAAVADVVFLLNQMFKEKQETREYLDCVKSKFKNLMLFLRRLEKQGWSIGRYIRKYDFHSTYLPSEKFVTSSVKNIGEVLSSFDSSLYMCNIHKKGTA